MRAPRPVEAERSAAATASSAPPAAPPARGAGTGAGPRHGPAGRRAAVVLALLAAGLALTSATGTWGTLDDCLADRERHARGTPERTLLHADDKHSQGVFILLFHLTYVGLVLTTLVETAGTGASAVGVAAFWAVDAGAAYAWRLAVYWFAVRPLGLAMDGSNCGTSKSISGHTHFYCFHMLQVAFLLWVDPPPFLRGRAPAPRSVGDTGDPRFMAWAARSCVKVYVVFVVCWTLGTLQQTYVLGFHSLRHMISGFAAAAVTVAGYVSLCFYGLGLWCCCVGWGRVREGSVGRGRGGDGRLGCGVVQVCSPLRLCSLPTATREKKFKPPHAPFPPFSSVMSCSETDPPPLFFLHSPCFVCSQILLRAWISDALVPRYVKDWRTASHEHQD